jgi:mono/diheme cytochrome c family protein
MLQRLIFERIEQRILVGTLSFLGIMVLVGWIAINEGARMQAFDQQYLARSIERGGMLFSANCSTCHGTDGLGSGRAPALNSPYLFGHDFLADLNLEQTTLERERDAEGTTPERVTEIEARLVEIQTERDARLASMQAAVNAPGDYDPTAPSRLSNLEWGGSLRSFVLTTLIHGRVNSNQYWNDPMVAWGQIAGGPLRTDQLEDLTNYILNYDKGSNWTIDDLLAVRQFPINVVNSELAGEPVEGIAEPDTDPTTLDLAAIDTELTNFQGDPTNGQALYNGTVLGCSGCHMNAAVAPPTEGTWTRVLDVRLADPANAGLTGEQYLAHSILHPSLYVAPDYAAAMPSNFSGRVSYQDLADLIAYLKTQDQPLPG